MKDFNEIIDKDHVYAIKKKGFVFSVDKLEEIMKSFENRKYLMTVTDSVMNVLRGFRDYYASALIFQYTPKKNLVYIDYYDPFLERINQVGVSDFYLSNVNQFFFRSLPLPKLIEMLRFMGKDVSIFYLENDDKVMFVSNKKYVGVIACLVNEQKLKDGEKVDQSNI